MVVPFTVWFRVVPVRADISAPAGMFEGATMMEVERRARNQRPRPSGGWRLRLILCVRRERDSSNNTKPH